MSEQKRWIGVDLDGTLAYYDYTWRGVEHIGEPIPKMVERVKVWLKAGTEVRILTARVGTQADRDLAATRKYIEAWCIKHIGTASP